MENGTEITVDSGKYLSDYLKFPAQGERWILSADTGIGKTFWALGLHKLYAQKTLVLTSLTGIVVQGGGLEWVDYWYEDRKTYDKATKEWHRGGNTIICTYDSAEKVARLIDLENYIVIFDESHNVAFSGYRSEAINTALGVSQRGKAIVAMSGTVRPIAHPAMANACLITASRLRTPINALFVQASGRDSFINLALASIDLNGRTVLFFNEKGKKLEALIEQIGAQYPMINIIPYNADTKTAEGVQEMIRFQEIKPGTLLICTAVLVEGINIQHIDNLIVAFPLHAELLHQLASRARRKLGGVIVFLPQSWVDNEGNDKDIEKIYNDTVRALKQRANGVIIEREFLAGISSRELFEFNALVPRLTRQDKENESEELDYVIIDCIAHARRAKAMSVATAAALLAQYSWVVTTADWQGKKKERMKKAKDKNLESWERIKDMSYPELTELAKKHWIQDSKLAKVYSKFIYTLADSEELLYENWLLDLARGLFTPETPSSAKGVLGIIEHARNQHKIYGRIVDIELRAWDKRELAAAVADCGRDTLVQSEIDRLRYFNPSDEGDCKRVLKIIKRYLQIGYKIARIEGVLIREWEVKGLAIESLGIEQETLERLIKERHGLIDRRDRKLVREPARQIEPLKTFMKVVYNGTLQTAEVVDCNTETGISLCTIGGVNKFFSLDRNSWLWHEFGKPAPSPVAEPTPTGTPAQSNLDGSWYANLAKEWDNYDYD